MEGTSIRFQVRALVTNAPIAAVTGTPVSPDDLLSIPITLATTTEDQTGTVFIFPTESSIVSGDSFGNNRGGINDIKTGVGLSRGALAAIVVVLILLLLTGAALVLLFRRGYLNNLRRKMKSSIDKRNISYPRDDKVRLTRVAAASAQSPPPAQDILRPIGKDSSFVMERQVPAYSLTNGQHWAVQSRPANVLGISALPQTPGTQRRSAPLPPTPAATMSDSATLGAATDWSSIHVRSGGRMDDPFVDHEGDRAIYGRGAMNDLDRFIGMDRQQTRRWVGT